jgi:chromosome segregation ATPase
MKNLNPLFIAVFVVCAMGTWGCSQQKTGAINAKIRDLESRYSKLEEDFRTVQASDELNKKRLAEAEAQRGQLESDKTTLTRQLDGAILEREKLRKQITQRTQERDSAHANLVQFSKDLQSLAGRVETALNDPQTIQSTAIIPASRRNE